MKTTQHFQYEIDSRQRIGYAVLQDGVDADDLIDLLQVLADDDRWERGYDFVFDLAAVSELRIRPSGTQDVKHVAEAYGELWGPGKTALIAPRDVLYWISRLFEMIVRIPGREIKVFKSRGEAVAWIGRADLPDPTLADAKSPETTAPASQVLR